jgi:flagellin-like protein
MNVFGKSERSWRKAQKRGVSPIIATILLVAITVVLAAVLYVLISGLTHGPGSTPVGSAFTAGNPVAGTCGAGSAQTVPPVAATTGGCKVGDFIYTLTVESSTVTFGSVLFEVKTPSGSVYAGGASASFAVLNIAGVVAADSTPGAAMAMSATWAGYNAAIGTGITSSTPLTNLFTIVIDVGAAAATTGQGLTFVALGTGSFSGTTGALSLP